MEKLLKWIKEKIQIKMGSIRLIGIITEMNDVFVVKQSREYYQFFYSYSNIWKLF